MKLSTRTRYAVRAIIELALNAEKKPLQLKIIAQHQDISVKYLEQLMAVLRSAGFVRSVRGAKGGYVLAKPQEQIKLNEVMHSLEGPITTVECVEDENYCGKAADCAARKVWIKVEHAIEDVLQSISVKELVDEVKNVENTYYQI